jgi:hypothetical protein
VGLPPAPAALFVVNEQDRAYVDSKLTPQPVGAYLQPTKLSGARDKVAKKTYIRRSRYPMPPFNEAISECKADPSWTVIENTTSGHFVMLDAPDWPDILMKVA